MRDILPKNWLVLFQSFKVVQVKDRLRSHLQLKETQLIAMWNLDPRLEPGLGMGY